MGKLSGNGVYYEVQGKGFPLILGYPFMASPVADQADNTALQGYLERLTDDYRVLTMDYPNVGQSKRFPQDQFTAQRLYDDLLDVADAAGFDRFIWWGFSWGGLIGLQLASRSDRVAALICGGWPPLDGPYADMLKAIRVIAADPPPRYTMPLDQYITFYESIQEWPEGDAVRRIQCPKMTFVGSADELDIGGVPIRLAAAIQRRRGDLESQGWRVTEIPGRDHWIYQDPNTVVPVVRQFLDPVVLTSGQAP
jgi:pimeloyl-ACP methyl ester carboxylesterase